MRPQTKTEDASGGLTRQGQGPVHLLIALKCQHHPPFSSILALFWRALLKNVAMARNE